MNNRQIKAAAAKLGKAAYANGTKCVPGFDATLMAFHDTLPTSKAKCTAMNGWMDGWCAASLADPLNDFNYVGSRHHY